MYVISSGRPPAIVKLKSYAHLAQGARYLAFYAYSPEYGWHEGGWGTTEAMYPALAELSREIGAAEEVLMTARPRPAAVAILYARPTDLWAMAEPLDNSQGVERMMTWLALQHAQVQNDVLVDQDVVDGRLAPYRVAYLHGLQVEEQMIAPLAAWVQAGGTLVLSPGAASRNEFNAPLPALDQALGLQRLALVHPAHVFHATAFISQMMKPLEPLTLLAAAGQPGGPADALVWTQRITPGPGAEVLARFADGAPAAVVQPVGQGRVVLLGYMPGLAYLRGAWVAHQQAWEVHRTTPAATPPPPIPTAWDAALRAALTAPAVRFAGPPPVTVSAPLVEATLLESDQGWAVPLANWSLQSLDAVAVTVRLGRPCHEVRSSRLGVLPITPAADGAVTVTLPLGTSDLLYGR
jgi:hypothetical protein